MPSNDAACGLLHVPHLPRLLLLCGFARHIRLVRQLGRAGFVSGDWKLQVQRISSSSSTNTPDSPKQWHRNTEQTLEGNRETRGTNDDEGRTDLDYAIHTGRTRPPYFGFFHGAVLTPQGHHLRTRNCADLRFQKQLRSTSPPDHLLR